MENIIFYFLFFSIIANGLFIILSKNPIHSILFLVLVFISTTILLIFLGVEFIAMLFLVIYIGAIIVLFLFVIMMLNIKIIEFNERFILYLPIGFSLGIIFILELFYLININFSIFKIINEIFFNNYFYVYNDYYYSIVKINNIENLSTILYTKFFYFFFLSGIILLIAMLGSIVLTLNHKFLNKKQDIYLQTIKSLKNAIRYLNVKNNKKA